MPKSSTEVFKDLKKKQYAPLYILHGEEPYYVEKIGNYLEEHALSPADRSFNQFIL